MFHIFDWLICHYFLQLIFRLTPLTSVAKNNQNLVNQNHCSYLWCPLTSLWKSTLDQFCYFKLHYWCHTVKRNAPPPPPPLFDSNSDGKNENQPPGGDNQQLMSATELGEHLDQEETQVEKFLSSKKLYLTGKFFWYFYFSAFTSLGAIRKLKKKGICCYSFPSLQL